MMGIQTYLEIFLCGIV